MSIATITASDILAGKQGDPDSFSIAHFDIAEADDRIDALISSDHYRPHYNEGRHAGRVVSPSRAIL